MCGGLHHSYTLLSDGLLGWGLGWTHDPHHLLRLDLWVHVWGPPPLLHSLQWWATWVRARVNTWPTPPTKAWFVGPCVRASTTLLHSLQWWATWVRARVNTWPTPPVGPCVRASPLLYSLQWWATWVRARVDTWPTPPTKAWFVGPCVRASTTPTLSSVMGYLGEG